MGMEFQITDYFQNEVQENINPLSTLYIYIARILFGAEALQ